MTQKLALGIEISADPAKAKAGLAETRKDLLATYADAKASVAKLNETLDQAQDKAQAMGKSMGAMGPPTKAMVADFERAKTAVNDAKVAVEKSAIALQQAGQATKNNAAAMTAVKQAADAMAAATTRAAAASTWSKQLAGAQALIDAENQLQREIRETAAARQATEAMAAAGMKATAARELTARNMANSASLDGLGVRPSSSIRTEMADASRAVATLKANGAAAQDIARASQAAQARIAALNAELNATAAAGNAAQGSMAGIAHRMAAMAAAAIAAREAVQLLKSSVDTGIQFDSLKTQYAFGNGGDVKKAADEMAYASQLSNRLGLELAGTTKAYGKLQAASRGTTLQGQATRDIFTAVASASAVMGLSAEEQSGTLLAISQMMSKGTISAEELRGQLGERLPGAFAIAAKAMRVTEADLGKLLESGQLTAEQFLPRFAAALQASVNAALPAAEASARANLQRLENAFIEFKLRIANSGLLDKVAEQLERLLQHIGNMADSGELDKLATGFAKAFGGAIQFMADAAIFAERFAGVLGPLASGLAAVMVGGRALALLGTSAPSLVAAGTAATAAAGGLGLLAGALRLLKSLTVGGIVLLGAEALIEWGARATEARAKAQALDAEIRQQIHTNNEHASATRLDAGSLAEFGDQAFEAYQKAIKGARDYAAAKVVDLTKSNKNGQFDGEIAQYRAQAVAYNDYLDTVLEGEKLRRQALKLTGQILTMEAAREKLLAGEVKQTRAEAIAEQIKGYEKLVDAIRSAREEAKKEAGEAKKKADDHRRKAADIQTSASDKATQIREKDLPEDERLARDKKRASDAQSDGNYYAAAAAAAQLDGRSKDFEKYAKEGEKFLDRAMKFAEKTQDADKIEAIGKTQADLEKNRAKSEDKKSADAEQRATGLMDQLNSAEAKLKELKGEAATLKVNADIAEAITKLTEVETKLAALSDKTVTVTVNTVSAGASTAPADTSEMTRQGRIDAIPARAYGGPLPGNAPHDRADNMMYWGTPGEWVIQRPAVRHYGSAFIAAVNAMQLPKFAFGGQLGNSAINRLAIPRMPAGRGESSRVGATFDLGNLGRVPVQMAEKDHDDLARRFALQALKFGGRR